MNIKKRFFGGIITTGLIVAMGVTMVQAGQYHLGYKTDVGAMGGNGFTTYQRKVIDGANGELVSRFVGGNYTVDARMLDPDGSKGSWQRNVDDSTTYVLDGHKDHRKGDSICVNFSNHFFTFVDVQVSGTWKSN